MSKAIKTAESFGYKIVSWESFVAATDRPEGLLQRAEKARAEFGGAFVLYDPMDDSDGFLIVGDNPEQLASELFPQDEA